MHVIDTAVAIPCTVAVCIADCVFCQALPYAFGKLGLRAKVYATLPVWKMGQMAVYDAYISRTHEARERETGWEAGGGDGGRGRGEPLLGVTWIIENSWLFRLFLEVYTIHSCCGFCGLPCPRCASGTVYVAHIQL